MSVPAFSNSYRCISAPLQPKVISNGIYVLSMTEISDQLFSQHTDDDFNFRECSNPSTHSLAVPDEYNDENEEEEEEK